MLNCWKCGEATEFTDQYAVPGSICKVPFRAACDHCSAWLHCCRGCKHYKPGMSNDCEVPGTEFIHDREAANHCEYFLILGKKVGSVSTTRDVEKRLFGEETEKPKNRFDDFFN